MSRTTDGPRVFRRARVSRATIGYMLRPEMERKFDAAITRLRTAAEQSANERQVRSVQEQLEAIGKGDYSAAVAGALDDVQLDIFAPSEFPFIRRARNKAELLKALETNFGSIADQTPEITNVLSQGDTLVLIGRERGVIRKSGRPYAVQFVHRFTFRDGRLASLQIVAAWADQ